MKRLLLLVAVLAPILAAPAQASADMLPAATWKLEQAGIALPVIPTVIPERCPSADSRGCTWSGGPIYLGPTGNLADLIHEIGHQFDYQLMHDTARDKFRALIGETRPWRAEGGNSPHEKFAEAVALCALRPRPYEGHIEGGYDYHPTVRRQRRICLLIRRVF